MEKGKRGIILKGVFLIAGVFIAILLYFYDPADSGIFPPCPINYLTGLYCPGCGSLRALHRILRGNFIEALDLNPLMAVMLPFVALLFISQLVLVLTGRKTFFPVHFNKWFYYVLLSVIIAFTIARNIPAYPFSLLRP